MYLKKKINKKQWKEKRDLGFMLGKIQFSVIFSIGELGKEYLANPHFLVKFLSQN